MRFSRLAFAAALCLTTSLAFADDKPLTREDVETIVKDYLTSHPDVVVDALKAFQQKEQVAQAAKAKTALKDQSKQIYDDPLSPVAGNPKGDVTVVEFFDYHCGYCKRMVPAVTKLIKEDPNVRFVFKEFPILSPDSELASKAALAVYQVAPKKYFDYYTALMGVSGKFDEDTVVDAATKLGIDGSALKEAMKKPDLDGEIKKNHELAALLGIQGTPGFIVGGNLIPGSVPYEELKKAVDEARKNKKS